MMLPKPTLRSLCYKNRMFSPFALDHVGNLQHNKKDNENDNEEQHNRAEGPLAGAQLKPPRRLQVLDAASRVRLRAVDVGFDVVDQVALRVHHDRHVHEDGVQLQQVLLDLSHAVVPLLNLPHGLDHVPAPLLPDRLLQERLALARADHALDRLLVRLLPRYVVVPAWRTQQGSFTPRVHADADPEVVDILCWTKKSSLHTHGITCLQPLSSGSKASCTFCCTHLDYKQIL